MNDLRASIALLRPFRNLRLNVPLKQTWRYFQAIRREVVAIDLRGNQGSGMANSNCETLFRYFQNQYSAL